MILTDTQLAYKKQAEKLRSIFMEAFENCTPYKLVERMFRVSGKELIIEKDRLTLGSNDRIYVIGAGKASVSMAEAVESILGDYICDGLIIAPQITGHSLKRIQVMKGSHPLPTIDSYVSTLELLDFISSIPEQSLVINLISGGASTLLSHPPFGVTMDSIQHLNILLLESGATISEINTVRKQFSKVKGGRLLSRLSHVRLVDLLLSDVPTNLPADIGSGPTIVDGSTVENAINILHKYNLFKKMPIDLTIYLKWIARKGSDKPKLGQDELLHHTIHTIGTSNTLATLVKESAERAGYNGWILNRPYSGDVKSIALQIAKQALNVRGNNVPVKKPAALIWHGESSIEVKGNGKGGRNQELALIVAMALEGQHFITMLSIGTDGIDGPTDAAGAIVNGLTTLEARKKDMNPQFFLNDNDSYTFFDNLKLHIKTGYTGQNLMDLQIILIDT